MSQITSLYVYKVVSQASEGVETDDLVSTLGLPPNGPIDPKQMVPSADYYRFFAALAERDPNGLSLPFRIGAAMRIDDYGAFGLAWKSAPTLQGSFARSERYGRVLGTAETYTVERSEQGVLFGLHKDGDGNPGMALSNEASLAAVVTIIEEVSSAAFRPLAILFKHPPRGELSLYENHFGCPVHFSTGRDAVLLSEQSLSVPNRLGDATIASFFDNHLEKEISDLALSESLEWQIRRAVAQALSEGVPTISDIASGLGMSARTLQRRLSDNQRSFQDLIDQTRRELAQRLLRESDFSLAEIAFLAGFSEQSGFTRAFKRWSGETPRSYRIGANRGG